MNSKTSLLMISAAFYLSAQVHAQDKRWYTPQQVEQGEVVFKQNCAACHGQNAELTINWKQPDANGIYPPPPLNGTAHAWHHDLDVLRQQIREGGQKYGGVMPPFGQVLSAEQIDMAISYFQSKWPDDLYQKWAKNFEVSSLPSLDDIVVANEKAITRRLQKQLGNVELDEVKATVIDDLWQVRVKDKYIYLLENGRYAVVGDLIDLESGRNISEQERRQSASDSMPK